MYGYFSFYPTFPALSSFSSTPFPYRVPYPAVDTKVFVHSVQIFRPLMQQGSRLLDRLSDPSFAQMIMAAAQENKKDQVDRLVKSIGLKAEITTHYTPSNVIFTLRSPENQHELFSCCALTITLRWG